MGGVATAASIAAMFMMATPIERHSGRAQFSGGKDSLALVYCCPHWTA